MEELKNFCSKSNFVKENILDDKKIIKDFDIDIKQRKKHFDNETSERDEIKRTNFIEWLIEEFFAEEYFNFIKDNKDNNELI